MQTALQDLKQYGRARLFIGRLPVWLDAPFEEEQVWLSLPLVDSSLWGEGRRQALMRLIEKFPALQHHLHLAGPAAFLRMEVSYRGLTEQTLREQIQRLLAMGRRWREWLLETASPPTP